MVLCATLLSFAPTSCGPPAQPAPSSNEILFDATDETDPSPFGTDPSPFGTVRPCLKDDPASCGMGDGPRGLVPGGHYAVRVLPSDPVLGPMRAPVSIVVFSDFQCPHCAALEPTLEELRDRYPDVVRIVWKDHPLGFHAWAMPAALLARQAFERGGHEAFWVAHGRIFADQDSLDETTLPDLAQELGLPWPPPDSAAVDANLEQARELGIRSTPTSFVNGRAVVGNQPLEAFTALIDDELARRRAPRSP